MDSRTDDEKAQDELIDQHVFYIVEDCSQGRKHIYSLILTRTPEEPCVPLCDDAIPFMSQTFDAAGTAIDVDGPVSGNASLVDTRERLYPPAQSCRSPIFSRGTSSPRPGL